MANIMWSSSHTADGLIKYFRDEKEGQAKGTRYLLAEGVNGALPMIAEHQFRDVRRKWGKDGRTKRYGKFGSEYVGGQYVHAYHGIMSFGRDELDPESPDDWVRAMRIAKALVVDRFPTRQAVLFLQADGTGGNLHVHAAVNSVDKESGRSIDSSVVTHSRKERQPDGTYRIAGMAVEFDRILASQGFQQRADLVAVMDAARTRAEHGGSARLRGKVRVERSEDRALLRYQAWEASREAALLEGQPFDEDPPFSVAIMKQRIQDALESPYSVDRASFHQELLMRSLQVSLPGETGRAGVSYAMLDEDGAPLPRQVRRGAKLGEDFMLEAVDLRLAENAALAAGLEVQAPALAGQSAPQSVPAAEPESSLADKLRTAVDEALESTESYCEEGFFSVLMDRYVWVDFPHESGEDDIVFGLVDKEDRRIPELSMRGADLGESYSLDAVLARIAVIAEETAAEREAADDAYVRYLAAQQSAAEESARRAAEQTAEAKAQAEQMQADASPNDAVPVDGAQAEAAPPAPATAPAVERSSATAPDLSREPAAAPAAESAAAPFRSQLRGLRMRAERAQAVLDAFIPFEERAHGLLLAGERVTEAEVPAGIGPKFIQAFAEQMSPLVLQMLELREAKKELREALYAEHAAAYRERKRLEEEAVARGDLEWKHGPEHQALTSKHDAAFEQRERLDREIQAGVYEEVLDGAPGEVSSRDEDLLDRARQAEQPAHQQRSTGPEL